MRKAAGKRLPHGATKGLVLAEIWKLYSETGKPELVSRAQLVEALRLPDTTIDDRLRVLVREGEVLKKGRGLYEPKRMERGPFFDKYWRQRRWAEQDATQESHTKYLNVIGGTTQNPIDSLSTMRPACIGEKLNPLILPDGSVVLRQKVSQEEFLRYESVRQRSEYPNSELRCDEGLCCTNTQSAADRLGT